MAVTASSRVLWDMAVVRLDGHLESTKGGLPKGDSSDNDSHVKDRDQMSTKGHSAVKVIPCSRTQLGSEELA